MLLAEARDIRVVVVSDGPLARQIFSVEAIEREIANVAGPGSRILLPPDKRFIGDWSLEGAARVGSVAGFTGGEDLVYDVGIVYYAYPQEGDFDYIEIYGSLAKDWWKTKLWYSNDFGGDSTSGDTAAWYLEGNATIPLPADFSILLHAGYSTGDFWDDVYGDDLIDYSVGVGYTAGKFNLALKYVDTDSDVEVTSDAFNNEGRVVFTVATTFPW